MSPHTPGPWSIDKYGHVKDANGDNVRAEGLTLTSTEQARANTRLIAAAPDLLEALQEATARSAARLAEVPGAKRTEDFEVLFQKCLAAIAKATGAA